jgi:hypothetical protein
LGHPTGSANLIAYSHRSVYLLNMRPETIVPVVLPIAFLAFGFFWTIGFVIFVIRRRSFLRRAQETMGTVIHVDERHYQPKSFGSTGSTHHYPTVRFQTGDGRTVDCKISVSLGERYEVGQTVIVNYDPANPLKRTQLGDRNAQPIWKYVMFIGMGAVFFLIGLVMTIVTFFIL